MYNKTKKYNKIFISSIQLKKNFKNIYRNAQVKIKNRTAIGKII